MNEESVAPQLEHTPAESPETKQPIWRRITLPIALAIVISLAGFIVVVGYALYWHSSDRKYDIARGGEESKNQALTVEDSATDRTSPIDAPATQQKIEYLQNEVRALSGMGKFDLDALSDQNLQLIESDQSAP